MFILFIAIEVEIKMRFLFLLILFEIQIDKNLATTKKKRDKINVLEYLDFVFCVLFFLFIM